MGVTIPRGEPDRWHQQIEAAQASQRRLMGRETNSCPECGACSLAYQKDCIRREKCAVRRG